MPHRAAAFDYDLIHAPLLALRRGRARAARSVVGAAGADVPHARPSQERRDARRDRARAGGADRRGERASWAPSTASWRPRRWSAPTSSSDYGADPSRIAVIPCGVDTNLFLPGDQAAARAALGLDDQPRLLYVGPPGADQGAGDAARRDGPAARRRHARCTCRSSAATPTSRSTGTRGRCGRAWPGSISGGTVTLRRRPAPGAAARLVRGRRRHRAALALRVVRHGRAGGDGVRDSRGRLPRGRAADHRARRRHRPAGARIRSGRAGRARSSACSATPTCASVSGARACSGRPGIAGPASPKPSAASTPRSSSARRPTSTPAAASDLASGAVPSRRRRLPVAGGRRSRTPVLHSRALWRPCWRFAIFRPIFRRAPAWCARSTACRGTSRRARRSPWSASRAAARSVTALSIMRLVAPPAGQHRRRPDPLQGPRSPHAVARTRCAASAAARSA